MHHLRASETGTGARGMHSALENVYEALVGALYLDGGWDVAEAFISRTLKPHLATERAEHPTNPKSYLQECVQRDHHEPPAYKLVGSSGPAHEPTFTAVALVDGIRCGRGSGSSKKEAEAAAALDALERMGYRITASSCSVSSVSEAPCTSSPSRSRASSRLPIEPT